MATGTAGTTARDYQKTLTHYLRIPVTYSDAGISSGVAKSSLPAGAIILRTNVVLSASFNAQTTNVLTAGLNGTTANNIVSTVTVSAAGFGATNHVPTGAALGALSADTPVYVKYTQTGTAATQGAANIIIEYAVQGDLNSATGA